MRTYTLTYTWTTYTFFKPVHEMTSCLESLPAKALPVAGEVWGAGTEPRGSSWSRKGGES